MQWNLVICTVYVLYRVFFVVVDIVGQQILPDFSIPLRQTVPPVTKECHYYDAAADSWVLSSAETIVGRFLSASVQTSTGEWWIMGGRETK